MIEYIRDMILGSFEASVDVDLAALIWSVDAKEHCVPNASEINSALHLVSRYSISKSESGIKIVSSNVQGLELISDADIEMAMNIYKSTFGLG